VTYALLIAFVNLLFFGKAIRDIWTLLPFMLSFSNCKLHFLVLLKSSLMASIRYAGA